MGGEFFTDFKSSNGIEISWSVEVLSNFKWFRGSIPLGGGRWVDGGGGRYGCVGGCPMHAYAYARMHTRTHMHVKHAKHAKHGCLHAGGHLQFYTCLCVHVWHVHVCACMWGHPPCPQISPDTPPPTCPLPRAAGSLKHQISITLELIEIIRFCLKILYLRTFLNSYRL